jgi:hypothetical protein
LASLWQELGARARVLLEGWVTYTAVGSFLLCFFGYLMLRFHLTTFGITTDLDVLDERYLFHAEGDEGM